MRWVRGLILSFFIFAGSGQLDYSEQKSKGKRWNGRVGAVGVLKQAEKYLVIRRSATVKAPNMICFPGGSVEEAEFADDAVRREMDEELRIDVRVLNHLWTSQTAWGTRLEWFQLALINPAQVPNPNEAEVGAFFWMTEAEILASDNLLGSMPTFFEALHTGKFAFVDS